MADYTAILEEFDAISGAANGYLSSSDTKIIPVDPPSSMTISPDQMTSLFGDVIPSTPAPAYRDRSPNRTPLEEQKLVELGFDETLEALTLDSKAQTQEQPWNIVHWLLTSDAQNGLIPQQQDSLFLPPLPRPHKSVSERSYCSSTKSSVTSYCSEKSALSSVTLDSESDAVKTRMRSRRRARKPARYHAYHDPEGESDSTLAGEVATQKTSAQKKPHVPKIPRYKRPCHINAEHRRRHKIKSGFEGLDELLPPSNIPGKDSQIAMLSRAKDYIRQLHEERSNHNQEIEELRQCVHDLNVDISSAQAMLPEDGLAQAGSGKEKTIPMDELFDKYTQDRTEDNWKFWIFSYFIRPLYYSYKKAVSCDMSTFGELAGRVKEWVARDMALVLLRPGSLKALCSFSKMSSVMTNPGRLPEEAKQAISKPRPNYRPTDSGYSSAS